MGSVRPSIQPSPTVSAPPTRLRAYINGRFLTQEVTGTQRFALETVRALDRLLMTTSAGDFPLHAELLTPRGASDPGLREIPMRRIGALSGHAWEQLELPLHARNGILVNLGNVAPLLKRRQCVMIYDASVYAFPEAYSPQFRMWYTLLLRQIGRQAMSITTTSYFSREELCERAGIPFDKIRVVSGGAEHILQVPADKEILGHNDLGARPFILAVTSQSAHKNFVGLLRALEHLDPEACDVVVTGARNARVFGDAAPDLRSRGRYLGYVTDGELRALYENATCLVYPSLYEGFGLPPLEAMACGCPVVVSRSGALTEVCGDSALYCNPRDPADIARATSAVLADPALREDLRKRGIEHAKQFTWEQSARTLTTVIRELAEY